MGEIGVLWTIGSMPLYEDFGFLPTKLVCKPEDFSGLSILIIPPGCILESRGAPQSLVDRVLKFIRDGGLVLGVCSGLQFLSKGVYTGRRFVRGLGVINVFFKRLVAIDFASALVRRSNWLTRGLVGSRLKCMHIHTYGCSVGDAPVFLESTLPRHNYFGGRITISSGFESEYENVVGVLPHFLLDYNSVLRRNLMREAGVREDQVLRRNREFRRRVERLVNAAWGFRSGVELKCLKILAVASGETGEGKTMITTALACGSRRLGYRVSVAKLGGDLRDLHPSIYILASRMTFKMGLAIAGSRGVYGWFSLVDYLRSTGLARGLLIIECVMGLLTGSCRRECYGKPCSTLEFLSRNKIPTILVVSCGRGGVEDAVERALLYTSILVENGVRVVGLVLNEYYGGLNEDLYVESRLSRLKVPVYKVPILRRSGELEPEVDLNVDSFCRLACLAAEKYIDAGEILARTPCYGCG